MPGSEPLTREDVLRMIHLTLSGHALSELLELWCGPGITDDQLSEFGMAPLYLDLLDPEDEIFNDYR